MDETEPDRSPSLTPSASGLERERSPGDELRDAQALAKAVHRIHALASGARVMADPDLRGMPPNSTEWDGTMRALEGLAEAIVEQAEDVMEAASDTLLASRIRAEAVRP